MFELVKRMAATVLAMLHTRAELFAVEVEEEVLRFFSYLILSLVALVCFSVTALLVILLVIVAFWDTNRIAAIICMMGIFGFGAIGITLYVCHAFRNKPRFLASTLDEISKDIEMIKPAHSVNQEPPQ